jgi:membrane protein
VTSAEPPRPPAGREPWWTRAYARVEDGIGAQRRRHRWLDHLARAGGRYQRTQGDLMAAGVTYFAFLGLFPVLLLAASIIGLVLAGDALLQQELFDAIREAFPGGVGEELVRQLQDAIAGAGYIGLIGLVGFVYAGLRTMDNLRIGMERTWKGQVDRPEFLRDNLQDLVALVVLGGIGLVSLGLTGALTQGTVRLLDLLGVSGGAGLGVLTWILGLTLAVTVDVAVFLWLLRIVPSISHPVRLLLPGAVFGAAGFEALKLIGGYYLTLISDSVTASAFGGAVGLLVWINLVARFSFFTAAWTATLRRIEAVSPPRTEEVPTAPTADGPPPEPDVRPGAGRSASPPR